MWNKRVKNVVQVFILLIALLLLSSSTVLANNKDKVNISVNPNKDINIKIQTDNSKNNQIVNIKLMDENEKIQYFNQVTINNGQAQIVLLPMSAKIGDNLILRLSGGVMDEIKFRYSSEDLSVIDNNTSGDYEELQNVLNNKFNKYTDKNGEIYFKYEVYKKADKNIIKMNGHFNKKDSLWRNKDNKRFYHFLELIAHEGHKILKDDVYIDIHDIKELVTQEYFYIKNSDKQISKEDFEDDLNKRYNIYDYDRKNMNLEFNYKVIKSKDSYKIMMYGQNFSYNDEIWMKRNTKLFKEFLEDIAKDYYMETKTDLNFIIYDKNNIKVFTYFYKNPYEKEDLDNDYGKIPADKIDLYNFYSYGDNYKIIGAENMIVKSSNNYDTVTSVLNDKNVVLKALKELNDNKQKSIVVSLIEAKYHTNLKIDKDIVDILRKEEAVLTLSTILYHTHIDFSKVDFEGDIILDVNIKNENVDKNQVSPIFVVDLKVDGKTIKEKINGVMGSISYGINDIYDVEDVRTINTKEVGLDKVYDSTSNMGFLGATFIPDGPGDYYLVDSSKEFLDIDNHWAESEIKILASKDLLMGKKPMLFFPQDNVSRAEFVTMIIRKLGLNLTTESYINDVKEDFWYHNYVNTAYRENLLPETFIDKFDGDKPINREEMAYIIVEAYKVLSDNNLLSSSLFYEDIDDISLWAAENISIATEHSLVQGWKNNFTPKANATRAEAARMIYNLYIAEGLLFE